MRECERCGRDSDTVETCPAGEWCIVCRDGRTDEFTAMGDDDDE